METADGKTIRFLFILQPEFPFNAFILASEALRIANQNSGQRHFSLELASETGEPVRGSNGMMLPVDVRLDDAGEAEVLLVFAGNLPTQYNSRKLLGRLRAAARFGAYVGGVDTGAFALAQAGMIATERQPEVVLHWEAEASFREQFRHAQPQNRIYAIAGKRVHCAGGVAALDMMLDLIARFRGEALANEVANAMIHRRRPDDEEQRSDTDRDAALPRRLETMVELMESHLDFPLTLPELAEALGLSERSLSRQCRKAFGESPMRLYLRIRLQAARNFLFYEDYSIKHIANACGFSYPAVFSRAFSAQFGLSPRAFRETIRKRQQDDMRPELRRLVEKPDK